MQKEAKDFLRKYATISIALQYSLMALFVVLAALNVFLEWMKTSFLIIFALITLLLIKAVQLWYRAKVEGIALEELNPPKMKAVLEAKSLYFYAPSRYLTAHYHNGDYQEVIDICNCMLKNKKEKQPWSYYYYIAGVCFQIGDIDGLRAACEKFEACRMLNPKIDIFCPLMKLYKLYANEEYDRLKKLYDSEEKAQYNKATYMICEYIHALNLYTLGEKESAKEIFEKISKAAPLLGVGKLSLKQLENLEQGNEYQTNQVKITPNENYKLNRRARKARVYYTIRRCCSVLIILMLALVLILEARQDKANKEAEQFKNELYSVIDEDYDNFEILAGFNIKKDDRTIEYMTAIENENGELVVGYYVSMQNDDKYSFVADCENVIVGEKYISDSPCTDYTIAYEVFERKGDLPSDYYVMRTITLNNKRLYICITDIYN